MTNNLEKLKFLAEFSYKFDQNYQSQFNFPYKLSILLYLEYLAVREGTLRFIII